MKKIALLVFLSCLFACSQATPPRAPNASRTPVAAIRAEAAGLVVPVESIKGDAAAGSPSAHAASQTVDQRHWSITLPAGWTVKEASPGGMEATRDAMPPTAIMILSQAIPSGMMPQTWAIAASLKVQNAAPKNFKVLKTESTLISFKGHVASITAITFATGFLIGAVAVVDEKQNLGYIIAATGAAQEGEMLANITKTFDIK
jgi:hypothetical protein